MPKNPPDSAPDAEKPVAGKPEGNARRYVYRLDPPRWRVGFLDEEGRFTPVNTYDTPEAAAIAAGRLNGHEPEVGND